nr:hypothetical protein [Klebsiella pneumoniae]
MLFHTIPRPINIDAKRANRVVEIRKVRISRSFLPKLTR